MKKIILSGLLILSLLLLGCEDVVVNNFDECVAAGNAVMKSYPEQCMHKGKTFINEKQNQEPGKFNSCSVDEDCIPLPYQCHPTSCINKEHESLFKPNEPMACTMIFMSNAAYNPEDCLCIQNNCVNKNLNNDS